MITRDSPERRLPKNILTKISLAFLSPSPSFPVPRQQVYSPPPLSAVTRIISPAPSVSDAEIIDASSYKHPTNTPQQKNECVAVTSTPRARHGDSFILVGPTISDAAEKSKKEPLLLQRVARGNRAEHMQPRCLIPIRLPQGPVQRFPQESRPPKPSTEHAFVTTTNASEQAETTTSCRPTSDES